MKICLVKLENGLQGLVVLRQIKRNTLLAKKTARTYIWIKYGTDLHDSSKSKWLIIVPLTIPIKKLFTHLEKKDIFKKDL